jgi:hypothetical protein
MKRNLIIGLVVFIAFVLIIAGAAITLLGQTEDENFVLNVGDYVTHQWFKNDTPYGSPRTFEVLGINGTYLQLKLIDFEGIWYSNQTKNQTIFAYDEIVMNDENFEYTFVGKDTITTYSGKSITTDHYVFINNIRTDIWIWNGILIREQDQDATGTQTFGTQTFELIDTNIPQLKD